LHTLFEGLGLSLDQGVTSDVVQDVAKLGNFLSHFFVVEVVHIALLISYLLRNALEEGTDNYRVIVALILLDFRGHGALRLRLGLDLADFEVFARLMIDNKSH
jgi:formate-dependent nitrite reductase membrane component NrfD